MKPYWDEFLRYAGLLEKALDQVSEDDAFRRPDANENSIAIILKHLTGNLRSRFTDFLTTDGEKKWRNRDSEFVISGETLPTLRDEWNKSWQILKDAVAPLTQDDLGKTITIRGVEFRVDEALARSLAHFSYHVGEIVFLARHWQGEQWRYLSIPPGKSHEYNKNPTREKGAQQGVEPSGSPEPVFALRVDDDLSLRLLAETDAQELFALFEENKEHLAEWQDWPNAINTLEDCRAFVVRRQREVAEGGALACVIVFQGHLVGMCTLSKIVPLLRKADLGYWIAREHQGKGLVTRSCRALISHAFTVMKLNRLALDFKHESGDSENTRSRRVAERLGFTEEGVLRQAGMTKGVTMDMVVYSLLAEEWREELGLSQDVE